MAIDWLVILTSVLAVAPAAVALLWGYSRYDGFFKDNVIFLYFMGGLIAGMGVAIFHAVLQGNTLAFVLGIPLLEQFAKTIIVNRRKWQGQPHAVFNGGAYGAGLGVMVSLWYSRGYLTPETLGWIATAQILGIAVGVTFLSIATGWVIGASVRDHQPFKGTFLAALVGIPLAFFIEYWRSFPETWVAAAMAAYGLLLLVYGLRKVLPGGLSQESHQAMRQKRRREIRGGH